MLNLMTVAILLGLFAAEAVQAEGKEYESIKCGRVHKVIEALNSQLPQDRVLRVDCEESFDTALWGFARGNFRVRVSLKAPVKLCSDSKYVYNERNEISPYIRVGSLMQYEAFRDIFEDHGIRLKFVTYGGNGISGYHISEMIFPYCQ